MILEIDRRRWMRGEQSVLHRESDQKMCCVGIFLNACGVEPECMSERSTARMITCTLPFDARWLVEQIPDLDRENTLDAADLYAVNDNRLLADSDREPWIARIFARHGVEVRFTN